MRITILYNAVAREATPDERDVLVQLGAVRESLARLGHTVDECPCSLNLEQLARLLTHRPPDLVFNLVESLAGTDRLLPMIPALLEQWGIPYTGNNFNALTLTNDKQVCKGHLRHLGLPTPEWMNSSGMFSNNAEGWKQSPSRRSFLVKTTCEHASWGLDDSAVARVESADELRRLLQERSRAWNKPCLAEEYIDGREFNLSLLAGPDGPTILPCAEISFDDFPEGQPRIVGYRAKWDDESFEAVHTPRSFAFSSADDPLLDELRRLALACWHGCELDGYARVDFRVDERGDPWILEINANPCLAPDAGFAAALAQADISFDSAIERIVNAAMRRVPTASDSRKSTSTPTESQVCVPRHRTRSDSMTMRTEVNPSDRERVREIVESTGFFTSAEVDVAVELVDERLAKGDASGYFFVFAEHEGVTVGYSCYGPIACTTHSFDLYWIAVDRNYQGLGVGRELLQESENRIAAAGGSRIYVETSSKPDYHSTRTFYEHTGYTLDATVIDFYAPKDDKCIYVKVLPID